MKSKKALDLSIWAFAFGYFACYIPYSALTKAVSSGMLDKMGGKGISGFSLLPVSVMTSMQNNDTFIYFQF